jgi:DNA-binding PadR family transcriptional regulator
MTDLFDYAAARATDPDTSKLAAKLLNPSTLYWACLKVLCTGPATSEEIARVSGHGLQSITPRLSPLEKAGLVEKTTMRRAGETGSARIVWAITDKGREATK